MQSSLPSSHAARRALRGLENTTPSPFSPRYKERLLDKGVGNAGDLLEEVALKGIASLGIHAGDQAAGGTANAAALDGMPSMAASRAPTRMPGLPQVGPQQLQAPKWSRAALTAVLVRALLLRAARGR